MGVGARKCLCPRLSMCVPFLRCCPYIFSCPVCNTTPDLRSITLYTRVYTGGTDQALVQDWDPCLRLAPLRPPILPCVIHLLCFAVLGGKACSVLPCPGVIYTERLHTTKKKKKKKKKKKVLALIPLL